MLIYVLLPLLIDVISCEALGEGIVSIQAMCTTRARECVSPPCRFYCPLSCEGNTTTQFNLDSEVCTTAKDILSDNNAVDVIISVDTVVVQSSDHTMSLRRRQTRPYCPGGMKLTQGASICITTCALPDYECPDNTISRCACPATEPILKDADKGKCVQTFRDCPPANSYILPKDGLEKFAFIEQPVDTVKKEGESIRMKCSVSGTTKYQYFWYKSNTLATGQHSITNSNDKHLIESGKEYLDINNLKAEDAGYYHCKVKSNDMYALISSSGYLRVEYYTEKATVKTEKTASKGSQYDVLKCDVPNSEPPTEITWYKDNKKVSDLRMFTIPDEQGSSFPQGALYIMNIDNDDAGTYDCKAKYNNEEYLLTQIDFVVNGFVSQPVYGPKIVAEMSGRSKVGDNAIFYCAGAGKPAPIVRWNKKDGSRIESSDSIFLEDNRRKLTIGNIRENQERAYHCTVSNDQGEDRKSILYLTIEPASYDITFIAKPQSHIIYPNKYTPFMLECAITKQGSPVMYWLKNGAILGVKNQRIITNTTNGVVNGTTPIRNTTLHFVTPNESDIGIYQCIVENKEQMRQATAYVNVRKGDVYDIDGSPKKYYAHDKAMPISDAESYCSKWQKNGHLVSIMNKNESEIVFGLMKDKNITQAWIGLTSEDDHSPGFWKWTQPGVPSTSFSYWYQGNPNNENGNENYAIMDITKSGRWYDVDNLSKDYPFVCKHYTTTCPSVSQFFNESAVPISMMETSTTKYGVGETVTVTCSEDTVKLQEILTCTSRGSFIPSVLACPVRNSCISLLYSCMSLLLISVICMT